MRKVIFGLSAAFTLLIAVAGLSRCLREAPVVVMNDVAYDVALVCGDFSGPGADPAFVTSSSRVTVHPYGTCLVYGPSSRREILRVEGPYMGCLVMPTGEDRRGDAVVRVSDVRPEMDFDACAGAR